MLIEALRLIVVVAVVLAANRLASANPSIGGDASPETVVLIVTALGAGVGYLLGGIVARAVDRLMRKGEEHVSHHHASEIVAATVGLLVGGIASAFIIWPVLVFVHPTYVALAISAFVAIVLLTFTSRLAVRKRLELFGVLGVTPGSEGASGGCLLDTSAAIDGRVLALYRAGLLPQPLCVPSFVLWEMQGIADSEDPLRRRRGQRGLDVLASLREAGATVRVIDEDPAATTDPDAKLVVVARRRGMPIVTSDGNLAKVAELQGVGVLSLHRLAELLRPPVLPGEKTTVRLVRAGRGPGQGVGFLDDGTMVVVEGGNRQLGEEVEVEVTSVLSNDTGRMLFGKLPGEQGHQGLREVR